MGCQQWTPFSALRLGTGRESVCSRSALHSDHPRFLVCAAGRAHPLGRMLPGHPCFLQGHTFPADTPSEESKLRAAGSTEFQ